MSNQDNSDKVFSNIFDDIVSYNDNKELWIVQNKTSQNI